MRTFWLAGLVMVASPVAAQQGAISLDALVADVIAGNPERQFYQRQIESAGV